MGTHDLRFLRIFFFFCKSSGFFDIINTINDDIRDQWSVFVVFSLVMASRGFVAVTVAYCCQNRREFTKCGQMPKFRNYRYFLYCLRVMTVLYLSVHFDHANCGQLQIFTSILRSSFFPR